MKSLVFNVSERSSQTFTDCKILHTKIIICVCFFFPLFIFSQDEVDFQPRFAVSVKTKPMKKWSVEIEEQLRFKDHASTIDQFFSEIYSDYGIVKNIKLGAGFRYLRNQDTKGKIQGYEDMIRYHIDCIYRKDFFRFSLKTRLRYQDRIDLEESTSSDERSEKHVRLKNSLKYDIKKWKLDPRISGELFHQVGNESKLSKYRLGAGTSYRIKKLGSLGLFYLLEQEVNVADPILAHIVKASFSFNLRLKKKYAF